MNTGLVLCRWKDSLSSSRTKERENSTRNDPRKFETFTKENNNTLYMIPTDNICIVNE